MSSALQRFFNRRRSNTSSTKQQQQQQRQRAQAAEDGLRGQESNPSSRRHTFQLDRNSSSLEAGSAHDSDFGPASVSHSSGGRPALTTSSLNSNSSIASSQAWARSRSRSIASALDPGRGLSVHDVLHASDQPSAQDEDEDDDDEMENNPLYTSLSTHLASVPDWGGTAIILVPRSDPHLTADILTEIHRSEPYSALHAFAPSRLFKDQYVSIARWNDSVKGRPDKAATDTQERDHQLEPSSLIDDALAHDVRHTEQSRHKVADAWDNVSITATLGNGANAVVHLAITVAAAGSGTVTRTVQREVRIIGEMTVYPPSPAQQAVSNARPSSSSAFEVLSRPVRAQRDKIRVRVLSVDDLIVPLDTLQLGVAPQHRRVPSDLRREYSNATTGESDSTAPSPAGSIAFPSLVLSDEDPDATCRPSDSGLYVRNVRGRADYLGNDVARSRASSAASSARFSTAGLDEASIDPVSAVIGPRRDFLSDLLLFIAPPPALAPIQSALETTFATLRRASADFASFVYVPGFEIASAARLRTAVVDRTLAVLDRQLSETSMMRLSPDASSRLVAAVENIASGTCIRKFYGALLHQYAEQDTELDKTLERYRAAGLTLRDFDVKMEAIKNRPARLADAIATFSKLGSPLPLVSDEHLDPADLLAHPSAAEVRSMMAFPERLPDLHLSQAGLTRSERSVSTATFVTIRTPSYVLGLLKSTIDAIAQAVSSANMSGSRSSLNLLSVATEKPTQIGMDELLPILAYVITRAGQTHLVSLMRYLQDFSIGSVSPESKWALVTTDAAIEFLRSDPLASRTSSHVAQRGAPASPPQIHRPMSSSSLVLNPSEARSSSDRPRRPSLVLQHGSWGSANARRTSLSAASVGLSSPSYTFHGTHSPPAEIDVNGSGYFGHVTSFSDEDHSISAIVRADSPNSLRTSLESFKLPGQPASAMRRLTRSSISGSGVTAPSTLAMRSSSILRAVGEGTAIVHDEQGGRSSSASPDLVGAETGTEYEQHSRSNSVGHASGRPATRSIVSDVSSTGKSKDLHIRERIVVRSPHRRPITYSSLSFSERRQALERVALAQAARSDAPVPAGVSASSSAMERTASENVPSSRTASRSSKQHGGSADPRRQSLDSLTALSMLNSLHNAGSPPSSAKFKRLSGSASPPLANSNSWFSFLSPTSESSSDGRAHDRTHSAPGSKTHQMNWHSPDTALAEGEGDPRSGVMVASSSSTPHMQEFRSLGSAAGESIMADQDGVRRTRSARSTSSISSGQDDTLPRTPSNSTLSAYLTLPQRMREHNLSSTLSGNSSSTSALASGSGAGRHSTGILPGRAAPSSHPIMHAESVIADLSPSAPGVPSATASVRGVLAGASVGGTAGAGSPKASQKPSHGLPYPPVGFRLHVPSPVHELADPLLGHGVPSPSASNASFPTR